MRTVMPTESQANFEKDRRHKDIDGDVLKAAAFAQTEAKYSAGEYKYTVFDNVDQASVRVTPDFTHSAWYLAGKQRRHVTLAWFTAIGQCEIPWFSRISQGKCLTG